ncbi:MAG: ribose-phosphate diphosphokinase [Clostridiales bacterium]|nr:ribose-phosphate diphosphokinase [Clostridiales bacterium]
MAPSAIALVPLQGMEWMAQGVQAYLQTICKDYPCEIFTVELPRFATGDGKAVLQNSIRGKDAYIFVDVGNYSVKYNIFGHENSLSPDDHFQNLVRTISAIGGKADRINVIAPLLYSARQDRRVARESLDCAVALQHLETIGVSNVMSFDLHDSRVQNATPFMGFDNLMPTYQTIKALCRSYDDLIFDEDHMVVVSPDFGGINRNFAYANELGIDLGMFYKRRNVQKVQDGKNPVELHKYIGPDVAGKDVLIIDDIIASGESMLDSALKIKQFGAKRIFVGVTFGFFTGGTEKFDAAYKDGILEAVFVTNASYRSEAVIQAPWYREVNLLKYISFYIYSVHTGSSVSTLLDPHAKIEELIRKYETQRQTMK